MSVIANSLNQEFCVGRGLLAFSITKSIATSFSSIGLLCRNLSWNFPMTLRLETLRFSLT